MRGAIKMFIFRCNNTIFMNVISVFLSTIENAELPITFRKLSNPQKPLINPSLLILLKDIRNTNPIGSTIKTAINRTLGRIQIYGSMFRNFFFTQTPHFFHHFKLKEFKNRPDLKQPGLFPMIGNMVLN